MIIQKRDQAVRRGLVFMFVLAAMVLGAQSTPAQTAVNIELETGGCLELENSSQQSTVRVKRANCNGSPEQRFTVVNKPGTGLWFFKLGTGASNRCLEINGADPTPGKNVTQWPCDNSDEQSFQLDSNITTAHARIIFSHNRMCWDADTSFTFVSQMPCDGTQNQRFKLVSAVVAAPTPVPTPANPTISSMTNAQFIAGWAAETNTKLPLTSGDIVLNRAIPHPASNHMELRGWTPGLVSSDSKRISQANALKPVFTVDYCKVGAAPRNINLLVRIFDSSQTSDHFYWILPKDCGAAPITPPTSTLSLDDQAWNLIANSTNVNDFRNYLNRFGQSGKHASQANQMIVQLTSPNSGSGMSNSAFMSNWASQQGAKFPLTIGSITLTRAIPNPSQNFVDLQGWTPALSGFDPRIKEQADNLKPALMVEYCASGAAPRNIRMRVNILDNTQMIGTGTSYWINPGDCASVGAPNPGTLSQEDLFWNSIQNSTNRQDFQNYLSRFGNNGKYAPLARLKLNQLPAGPGTTNPGNLTPEDQFWKSIEFSRNQSDFQTYLTRFGSNGKYAALARLKISQLPAPQSPDDQKWDSVKNSSDPNDLQSYMNAFPNGKHVQEAKQKKSRIENQNAEANFLRNAEFGSLGEISTFRKVFITATDFNSRSRIVSELQKKIPSLVIVGNRQSADFFIEYQLTVTMACDPGTSTAVNACELHTGKIWVHTLKLMGTGNEFNRILWTRTKSKSYSDQGVNLFTKNPAAQTVSDLIKELKELGF